MKWLTVAGVIGLITLAGFIGLGQLTSSNHQQVSAITLPDAQLIDLKGDPRNLQEWHGKLLVMNFWATWCPPCREEIPLFITTQQRYKDSDLQFLGIALDEPAMVREFVDNYRINYPTLIGGPSAVELAHRFGNRFDSLPFTVVFDREGNIRYAQTGRITQVDINQEIIPLL